jgi:hypothetical protein
MTVIALGEEMLACGQQAHAGAHRRLNGPGQNQLNFTRCVIFFSLARPPNGLSLYEFPGYSSLLFISYKLQN